MHMADALLSPAVGGAMWAVSSGLAAYSARKVQKNLDEKKVPLMGVLGAFIFAAQMINFSIPATGSSGHLGGGMILAILLGPWAAFLTIASVLTVQALFFADGGLLALGCNIFNLGFFPCFVAYPLIYKQIAGVHPSKGKLFCASIAASVVGLQLGAFSVVLETFFSGISSLPLFAFLLLMQPIHLAIGLVEGLITAAVMLFIWRERPEIIRAEPMGKLSLKPLLIGIVTITFVTAGILSSFASSRPDGLEWSIAAITGHNELEASTEVHSMVAEIQKKTSFFPDYSFSGTDKTTENQPAASRTSLLDIDGGTSVAGIAGSIFTLLLIGLISKGLRLSAKH